VTLRVAAAACLFAQTTPTSRAVFAKPAKDGGVLQPKPNLTCDSDVFKTRS